MADILQMGWPFACVCIAVVIASVVIYCVRRTTQPEVTISGTPIGFVGD